MLIGIIIFIFGLIFGSFLNALEYRITNKKTMSGRSFCPKCKQKLGLLDLIPVLSWFVLRGKCQYCKKKISFQYPLIEILTGLSFVLSGIQTGLITNLNNYLLLNTSNFPIKEIILFLLLTTCYFLLILIALHDAKTKYVLSVYVYAIIIFAFSYKLIIYPGNWVPIDLWNHFWPTLLAAAIPALILFGLSFGSKGKWMGAGDGEIALAIGMLLGWQLAIPAYYFAFVVGAAWSLALVFQKKAGMKSTVPLGPFLISGTFFAIIFGQQIVDWYAKIVLGL